MVCDIAVIGGGMAGASVAAELAADHSVVLMEGERAAGTHSTGRSAASFLPSYGGPLVRRLTEASRALYEERSERLSRALLRPRPLLWLATDTDGERALDRTRHANPSLAPLTAREAKTLFPALRTETVLAAALDSAACDIDVAALHQSYLSELARRKGTTLLNARVEAVRRAGPDWQVTAGDTVVGCAAVVDAAGAWADHVAALAGVPAIGLRPKRRTAFLSPPHHDGASGDWPLVVDACERWYAKPQGGLVLVSPADETDSPACDARPDEVAVALAVEAVNTATTLGLRSVRHAWAGLRSFVRDREPVVGAWPEHEGFHFLAGQGGYGIQMAPALARLAAAVVAHGRLTARTAGWGVAPQDLAPARLRA